MPKKKTGALSEVHELRKMFRPGNELHAQEKFFPKITRIVEVGTDIQVVDALSTLPPQESYQASRRLLLERLWKLDGFIDDSYYKDRFDVIPLLKSECHEMVNRFGARKVIKFLRPRVLRKAHSNNQLTAQAQGTP